ncbi:uncharacterized protein LODBEIA_P55010 [Lodderomyces beijingensis]|uniref:DUF3835 domain-containing protein n=1 Tax=Lodderomyces beijingensis TaxID=1775926 RepID=A0ABP0ZT25_9ASCO
MSETGVSGKTELSELLKQLDATIDNLERKRSQLHAQVHQSTDSKQTESGKKNKPGEDTSLGKLIGQFDAKLKQAHSTRENLIKLGELSQGPAVKEEDKLNEENLPFMDIQEEYDEDGNIISVKINEEPFEIDKSSTKKNGGKKVQASDGGSAHKRSQPANKENGNHQVKEGKEVDEREEEEELRQLFKDMELLPHRRDKRAINIDQDELLKKIDNLQVTPQEKQDLRKACVEAFSALHEDTNNESSAKDGKTQKGVFNPTAIDKGDLLELELLAEDVKDEDEDGDGREQPVNNDDEFDYDFEEDDDDDDEDEDDEYSDNILYGNARDGSWFGRKDHKDANNLMWQQINKLRSSREHPPQKHELVANEVEMEAVEEPKKKQKSVRFAENLDIKNVENISGSLKNPPPAPRKQSLFKQNRTGLRASPMQSEKNEQEHAEDHDAVKETIVERDPGGVEDANKDDGVVGDVMEKDGFGVEELKPSHPTKRPVSRFKAMSSKSGSNSTSPSSAETKNMATTQQNGEKTNSHQLEEEQVEDGDEKGQSVKATQLDYHNMHEDLDTMAKAYVLGMYDDDITTQGPVLEHLDDFAGHNKMVEEKKRSGALSVHDEGSANSDEIGMDYRDEDNMDIDEDDNGAIMTDDIVETEFDDADGDAGKFDEDEIHLREVRDDYYRLRQKMISQQNGYKQPSKEEREFIPVDENGNDVKVSRFKAGRLRPT